MPESVLDGAARSTGRFSLAKVTLTDFRCYRHLRLEIDPRPVVLTGPNGAGKTNLLEAVSFLVPGRGLRNATLAEVARHEPDEDEAGRAWAVAATVLTPSGAVDLGTGREAAALAEGRERRVVRINGETARNQAVLAEQMAAVWLTPRMDRLFTEGGSGRRRFVDRLVFGVDPAHAGRVSAYEQAMRERARLLKATPGGRGADPAWLSALEETMAARGVAIAAARKEMTAHLAAYCRQPVGPFPGAVVGLEGEVETWLEAGPALAAEDRFKAALAQARRTDADSGGAAIGPHRSDLVVYDAVSGAPADRCSTGQQKALLIAIVLASARMQATERGSVPVLLMDEVAAHLDSGRREALFEELLAIGAQAWLAGTDAETFAPLKGRAQFLGVAEATVTRHRLIGKKRPTQDDRRYQRDPRNRDQQRHLRRRVHQGAARPRGRPQASRHVHR